MTPSTPSASQKPGADEGMEDVKVQEEAKVPQSPQESPPRCSGCTSKLESLHERDRVIKTLRASLERERQARAQMESKFKATSDKSVAAEKQAAEALGKAKAAEKRAQDLDAKLESTIKACRSDRRKAVEEIELIQQRCDQTIEELRLNTQKQAEYAREEYEDTIKSIRVEAEKRVKEVEENASQDARAVALDKVQEAQSESAKAEAEVQDLKRELEKLTEEKSDILDQLNQINRKNEREKYVLYEKIEFMDQQYQERMDQREGIIRNEMQALHEKQIKEVLHELEWEKQKLLLYKKWAENELEDNKELFEEIRMIHEENVIHQKQLYESAHIIKMDLIHRQKQVEEEMRVLRDEVFSFMDSMMSPVSPDQQQPSIQTLHKKVQKLKASYTYLKFRSMMGKDKKQNDENIAQVKRTATVGPEPVAEENFVGNNPISSAQPSPMFQTVRVASTPPVKIKGTESSKKAEPGFSKPANSPYRYSTQNKETFVSTHMRRSQSARPARVNGTEISTLKPSSASFTPNFNHLKPLKSVKDVTNLGMGGLKSSPSSEFNLKDFRNIERKKSGRSTLKL